MPAGGKGRGGRAMTQGAKASAQHLLITGVGLLVKRRAVPSPFSVYCQHPAVSCCHRFLFALATSLP